MRLILLAPIVLLATVQGAYAQGVECGLTPDSKPYRTINAEGVVSYPGYAEVLARWSGCLKDKADKALDAANKLRKDGVKQTVGNVLGERVEDVMGVTPGSIPRDPGVAVAGRAIDTAIDRSGGSKVSRATASLSTGIALDTTSRAVSAFDAAMAQTGGPQVAAPPSYAPSFARVGTPSPTSSVQNAFEAATARTNATAGQNIARSAAASSAYQGNVATLQDESEYLQVEYKARQAAKMRDIRRKQAEMRQMDALLQSRLPTRSSSSKQSPSVTPRSTVRSTEQGISYGIPK